MRKHGKNIVITLVSLILGVALTIQFKTINKEKIVVDFLFKEQNR